MNEEEEEEEEKKEEEKKEEEEEEQEEENDLMLPGMRGHSVMLQHRHRSEAHRSC